MKQYVVDAFTEKVFGGNPAAVCVMPAWLPDELLMNIAREKQSVRNRVCACTKMGITACVGLRAGRRRSTCAANATLAAALRDHALLSAGGDGF